MALPNTIIAGQGKSGTTTIYEILHAHHDAFVPNVKECGFLSFPEMNFYGTPYYESSFYYDYNGEKVIADCHSATMFLPENPRRIYDLLGDDIKFVFTLRNPIDRAISHYKMALRQLRESLTFEEAIRQEASRYAVDLKIGIGMSYIGRGYYFRQIQRFLDYFPKENMLFLIYENDFFSNFENTIKRLYSFLEIEETFVPSNSLHSNKSPGTLDFELKNGVLKYHDKRIVKPTEQLVQRAKFAKEAYRYEISHEYRVSLYKMFFEEDIGSLEKLIGINLLHWKPNI